MAVVRIRLCDADRERYDVGDLELDVEALKDLTGEELDALDQDLQIPVGVYVSEIEADRLQPAATRRVVVWLALRLAGKDTKWADTAAVRVLRAEFDRETIPGPPAGPSEASSEDEASEHSSET